MSGPLTWKERNRDDVWVAARARVMARHQISKSEVMDYWVIEELHDEALKMVSAVTGKPSFAPSQVALVIPPLVGTMKRSEVEQAAALIVYVCTVKGDAWQPMTFDDVQVATKAALAAKEPTPREKWLLDMIRNPFIHPDVHKLVALGFAKKLSADGEPIVVELLPAGLDAIERWVTR